MSEAGKLALKLVGDFFGFVVRVAVDVDDFEVVGGLFGEIFEQAGKVFFFVEGRDNDGDERCFRFDHRLTVKI